MITTLYIITSLQMVVRGQPDAGAQRRERHLAEPREQERFGRGERFAEHSVDGLLDGASRRLGAVAEREQRRTTERGVNIAQRDRRQVAGE